MSHAERMEPLLTIDEAAQILKIKKSTLYTWAYRRRIPSQKVGKALRFQPQELEKWLKGQKQPLRRDDEPRIK